MSKSKKSLSVKSMSIIEFRLIGGVRLMYWRGRVWLRLLFLDGMNSARSLEVRRIEVHIVKISLPVASMILTERITNILIQRLYDTRRNGRIHKIAKGLVNWMSGNAQSRRFLLLWQQKLLEIMKQPTKKDGIIQ